MTDSSAVPATTDRIAQLLAAHNIRGSKPLSMSGVVFAQECPCGFQWEVYAEWAEHLAAALAVLVADAQTDAWERVEELHNTWATQDTPIAPSFLAKELRAAIDGTEYPVALA